MTIIDGKQTASEIKESLKSEIEGYREESGTVPTLAIITVGDDPASQVYVRNKKKACDEVGIRWVHETLPSDTAQESLDSYVDLYGKDDSVDGIIVQLPLPGGLNADRMELYPEKDVDGFTAVNLGKVMKGDFKNCYLPATPKGIVTLLKKYDIRTEGKNVVMIGRSDIVGKPMANILMNKPYNANVTVLHSRTSEGDVKEYLQKADIIIVAIGKAKWLNYEKLTIGDWPEFNSNLTIIDVGMDRDENGKLCGDVNYDEMKNCSKYITPVPGGVGPMTVASLLENTVQAYRRKYEK